MAKYARLNKLDVPSNAEFKTIGDVSAELKIPQHVLRFWESKFSEIKPMKRKGGHRYYRPQDVQKVQEISQLLYEEGFTIKGAQKFLKKNKGQTLKSTVTELNQPDLVETKESVKQPNMFDAHKVPSDVPADVRKIQPNVIIMDIQLPNISGMDIISELKIDEELKPIPIIAVTAFALQEDKDNILSTGCDEYISKPISINIFLETIKKYI